MNHRRGTKKFHLSHLISNFILHLVLLLLGCLIAASNEHRP
jgi:hypothetical protein